MTPEEESEVGKLAAAGDEEAQKKLVEANLRFVLSVGAVGLAGDAVWMVEAQNSMGTLEIIRFSPHRPRICGLLSGPEPGLISPWNGKMSPSCRWGLRAARLTTL